MYNLLQEKDFTNKFKSISQSFVNKIKSICKLYRSDFTLWSNNLIAYFIRTNYRISKNVYINFLSICCEYVKIEFSFLQMKVENLSKKLLHFPQAFRIFWKYHLVWQVLWWMLYVFSPVDTVICPISWLVLLLVLWIKLYTMILGYFYFIFADYYGYYHQRKQMTTWS